MVISIHLPPPVMIERTADRALVTHMLCCSWAMCFSAAASSENDQGSMNFASNTASGSAIMPSWVAAIQRFNLRDQRETATTSAPRLRRRKQPPTTLVKPRADRLPSQPNRRLVDHAIELRPFATSRNPQHLIIPTQDDDPSRFSYCPKCP